MVKKYSLASANLSLYSIILLSILLLFANSLTQHVNFPLMTDMKSGDHKLLFTSKTGTTNFTYQQGYYSQGTSITGTGNPIAIISIRDLKIDQTTQLIDYYVQINISTIKATDFYTYVQIRSNITISLLYYMYMVIRQTFPNTYFYFFSINTDNYFNSTNGLSTNFRKTITQSIVNFEKAKVSALIASFSIQDTIQYSFSVSASMINTSTINIRMASNSSLYRMQLYVVLVDQYNYQLKKTSIYDKSTFYSYNSGSDTRFNLRVSSFNYFNYLSGLTDIRISASQAINFYVTPYNNIQTENSFYFIQFQLMHWRQSQCINSSIPYFSLEQLKCYDNCSLSTKNNYGTNTTFSYCQKCSYYCASCLGNGISCINCSVSSNRTLNSTTLKCECLKNGTYDDGINILCSTCHYTCQTCSSSANTCVTCDSTRIIQNSLCACKSGKFDSGLNSSICLSCNDNCVTCLQTAIKCTSCNSSANRELDPQTSTCVCKQLYEPNGTVLCILTNLQCNFICKTCQKISTNCTSCFVENKRNLINNICTCLSGYSQINSTHCGEICGDGLIIENTTQCDDGNTNNGDGCSSTCQIQDNFNCTNSINSPTICKNMIGYTVSVLSLNRNPFGNDVTLKISLSPPYFNTTISLLSLEEYLDVISQSSSSGTIFTLNLLIKKEITNEPVIKLGFTNIAPTGQTKLIQSSNLDLKPYNQSYLSVIKASHYLSIIYTALLWTISIFFIIKFQKQMISSILQFFMINALVWIAVEGQQKYYLVLQSLKNLQYIFIYNIPLSNDFGLFSKINIGFMYNIIPLLFFIVLVIANRLKFIHISLGTKRFILYDCTYAFMILNGVLISYGLQQTGENRSLNSGSSIGIAIGVIYLIIMLIMSWRFEASITNLIETSTSFQFIKSNYLNPKIIPFHYLFFYFMITIYLITKSLFFNNVFVLIIYSLGVTLMFYKFNFIINKFRFMVNFVILIIILILILFLSNVSNASWVGLTILLILYCLLIFNFIMIYLEKDSKTIDFLDDLSQRDQLQKVKNIKKSLVDNIDETFSQNKHYNDVFQIYNPQLKSSKNQKFRQTPKKNQMNEFSQRQRFGETDDKKRDFAPSAIKNIKLGAELLEQKSYFNQKYKRQLIEMVQIPFDNDIENQKAKQKQNNNQQDQPQWYEVKSTKGRVINQERIRVQQQDKENNIKIEPQKRSDKYKENRQLIDIEKMQVDMDQI